MRRASPGDFGRIAVGTAVASRPRADPYLSFYSYGSCLESNAKTARAAPELACARRTDRVTCVCSASVCGASRPVQRSSWLSPFPRQIPPPVQFRRCSPVSSVLRTHLTSHLRSCQPCPFGSLTALVIAEAIRGAGGISRFSRLEFSTHAQVLRLRHARVTPCRLRCDRSCLPLLMTRSAHGSPDFGAQ